LPGAVYAEVTVGYTQVLIVSDVLEFVQNIQCLSSAHYRHFFHSSHNYAQSLTSIKPLHPTVWSWVILSWYLHLQCESKNPPSWYLTFFIFFQKRLRILIDFFSHRFRDIDAFSSKIAGLSHPPLFDAPSALRNLYAAEKYI